MATQLKQMIGVEFVKKIIAGERDFSGIELEEDFNLSGYEGFREMNRYLQAQNLQENPLVIRNSQFRFVKAIGLYLPYVEGIEADLGGANLRGSYLREANLERAYLRGAYLRGAYLGEANLRGVRDLEQALNLGRAIFRKTGVTSKEKTIIEEALKQGEFFDVQE